MHKFMATRICSQGTYCVSGYSIILEDLKLQAQESMQHNIQDVFISEI